jgi:hypothetical protein
LVEGFAGGVPGGFDLGGAAAGEDDEHLAPVVGVWVALGEAGLCEAVDQAGGLSGGQSGQLRDLARGAGPGNEIDRILVFAQEPEDAKLTDRAMTLNA